MLSVHCDWPTGDSIYRFPRLATWRSRIASTMIYYLVKSFVSLSRLNYQYTFFVHSLVARREKCKNFWITFICKTSTAKILVSCLIVKYTCHEKFQVYGIRKTQYTYVLVLGDLSVNIVIVINLLNQFSYMQLNNSYKPVYRYISYVYIITIFSALLLQFSMKLATQKTTISV